MPTGSGTITIQLPDILKVFVNGIDYTDHVINFEFVEQKNLVGEFEVEMVAITSADRDTVKRGNDVQLRLANKLIFKGIIQRPEYKTDQFCTVRGFGATETLMKSISAKQTASSDSVSSDGRISYGFDTTSGVSTVDIVAEQISGVPSVYINTNKYLGHLTVRAEYDNVLSFLDGIVGTMSGVWWGSYGDFPYNVNYYNVSDKRTDSTASKKSFLVSGSASNVVSMDREVDEEELWTSVIALGAGDADNQLQSRVYHATDNFTFVSQPVDEDDTTINVLDTTGFPSDTSFTVDDFEDGDYTSDPEWTVHGDATVSVQGVTVKNGSYSLKIATEANNDTTYVETAIPSGRFYSCWMNTADTSDACYMSISDGNNTIRAGIYGGNFFWKVGNGPVTSNAVGASDDTWYKVEILYDSNTSNMSFFFYDASLNLLDSKTNLRILPSWGFNPFSPTVIRLIKSWSVLTDADCYFDDVYIDRNGILIGNELVTYTGTTATSFTGCNRREFGGIVLGYRHYKRYAHSKGVAVFDASYSETATDGNSKIDTYGLKQKTLVDKRITSQDALDLLATNTLINHYEPVERIEIIPGDMYDCLKNLDMDDRVTVEDSDAGISGTYAIVGQKVEMKEGYESLTYEVQNIRPTFTQDLRTVQADTKATSNYGQGSTAIINRSFISGVEGHTADIKVYLPRDTKNITRAEITSKITADDTYTLEYGLMSGALETVQASVASGVIVDMTDWLASGVTLSDGNWMLVRITPAGSGAIDDAELFAKVYIEGTKNA